MRTIPNERVENELGKASFFAPVKLVGAATYLHGIDAFDEIKAEKPSEVLPPLNLKLLPRGIEVSMMHRFKMRTAGIPFSEIRRIELAQPDEIIEQQEKSVIGRAIIGGLLLGPVGAIVGGMSGLKDGTKTTYSDSLLTILVDQDGKPDHFVASVKASDRGQVDSFLKKHLGQYYTTG